MKKVLYQIGHYGFFLNAILHKLIYHKNDYAIFIFDKVLMGEFSVKFLEGNKKYFKNYGDIYIYSDKDIIKISNEATVLEKEIDSYFDTFLSSNNIKIDDFDEIYSIFDTFNAFGVYLTKNKISFNMIEISENQCQNHNKYRANDLSSAYGSIIYKYLALTCDNKYVKKIFCNVKAHDVNIPYEENINAVEMLKRISEDEIKTIIDCFHLKYNTKFNYVCYMPNSHWITDVYFKLPHIYYMLLNELILDLFLPKNLKLLIKPHPSTDFDIKIWKKYFNDADVIGSYFPSILLTHINDLNIYKTLSTGTTGVDLKSNKNISIPFSVLLNYRIINKLFVAINLIKYFDLKDFELNFLGINEEFLNCFVHNFYKNTINAKKLDFNNNKQIVIIDDINLGSNIGQIKLCNYLKQATNDSLFIFLNSKNDFCFDIQDGEINNNILTISIQKNNFKEYCIDELTPEKIYIYTKNIELKNLIKKYQFKYCFDYVGLNLIAQFSNESYSSNNMFSILKDFNLLNENIPFYNYTELFKLYTTFIVDKLIYNNDKYHFYGINREFLSAFKCKNFTPFLNNNPFGINTKILLGEIFTIINILPDSELKNIETALINASGNTIVIFLHNYFNKMISLKNLYLLDYIVPVKIEKERINSNSTNLNTEFIYFYCKNEEVRNKLKTLEFSKMLINCGIRIFTKFNEIENLKLMNNIKDQILINQIQSQQNEIENLKKILLDKGDKK